MTEMEDRLLDAPSGDDEHGTRDAASAPFMWSATGVRLIIPYWRALLWVSSAIGSLRRIKIDLRVLASLLLLGAAIVFAIQHNWTMVTVFGVAWVGLLLLIALANTRGRFIIGEFKAGAAGAASAASDKDAADVPGVDLSKLLLVELSRMGDLFRVVGDRRAVSSEFSHQQALDATLSVDALSQALQGTVSADTKLSIGPVSIPLAPFITLIGKLLQAPRLTGDLHRDGSVLILTAQTTGHAALSWRVEARSTEQPSSEALLSGMVRELALRIYTDLALGRSVRWEATDRFVEGLQRFRSSLRTPKDRKVNLQKVEDLLLQSLAEDEDFPLAYYNLGVVYTELHGLAVAAGRAAEAQARLSAAETSFGRAIEKDPTRWEGYFAFAQTQFRYSRFDSVLEFCRQMGELKRTPSEKAKTYELWARALDRRQESDDYRLALRRARQASSRALGQLVKARLFDRPAANVGLDREAQSGALASACLLTYSAIVARRVPPARSLEKHPARRWYAWRLQRRARALTKLAPHANGRAELRAKLGRRALAGGYYRVAETELSAAVRAEPTRPWYTAGLALAIATRLRNDTDPKRSQINDPERREIVALCLRSLQAMVGAFFPARDASACETVADAYAQMNNEKLGDPETARELKQVAIDVKERLTKSVGGESVSGAFLETLQFSQVKLISEIGEYGGAVHAARLNLEFGQTADQRGDRDSALSSFRLALALAERARSLNPLSTVAWETLGDAHRELSDFQNARFAWKQALGTDPDNPRLYNKIGSSYWRLADDARIGGDRKDLTKAAQLFGNALTLYPKGSFKERTAIHYRLGKVHASLRNFEKAKRHLEIVKAVGQTPLVGWDLLGFAYLERRNYTEAEDYFNRVVKEGEKLRRKRPADAVIGDRLDEQHWPLNLILTWGHVGLAISHIERDGSLQVAERHLSRADELLTQLGVDLKDPAQDPRFPTRAPATILECRGRIWLRKREVENAVLALERAVSCFPHSRAYYGLALALEEQAIKDAEDRREIVARATRLLSHAQCLRPATGTSGEVEEALSRLSRLGSTNGTG